MGILASYSTNEGSYNILDDNMCTLEREYLTNPVIDWYSTFLRDSDSLSLTCDASYSSGTPTEYCALFINNNNILTYDSYSQTSRLYVLAHVYGGSVNISREYSPTFPLTIVPCKDGSLFGLVSTNIPIFTYADYEYYRIYVNQNKTQEVRDEALKHALNYSSGATVPETKEYYYYGQAEQYTVDEFGNSTQTNEPSIYRGIRVKTQGTMSLYKIDGIDNGVLKYGINIFTTPQIAYYSNDGVTWQNMAGSPTSLPYDYLYRNWSREIGTFYALSLSPDNVIQTNIPIFATKEESDDYNETGEGIEGAINYNEISTDNPPSNITGEEDNETEFGSVGVRSIFSQQYILSTSALSEIANAFFDITQGGVTGIFEDIKKGCEMYGESVCDDIENLTFYPVNLNTVFGANVLSQNYIYFGGYQFNMQNSVGRILYPNGYYDFGSFQIETTFGDNFRSYEPYTKLYCYLAYIGWVQLDMKKYLHKTVSIRYYIDTRTGGCVAVIMANGVMCDFFNGQIGVSMPIKATDFNAYANAQIQTLLGFGKGLVGQGQNVANVGQQMANAGASMGELAVGGVALAGVGASVQGAKTLYGLTQNNINNFNHTIGGSSSMLNMFLPQECCFMFEVQEAINTEYERELIGLPSNASGSVGSFNGYLECEQVNLVCSGATAKEQAEIIRYLYNGVYI